MIAGNLSVPEIEKNLAPGRTYRIFLLLEIETDSLSVSA